MRSITISHRDREPFLNRSAWSKPRELFASKQPPNAYKNSIVFKKAWLQTTINYVWVFRIQALETSLSLWSKTIIICNARHTLACLSTVPVPDYGRLNFFFSTIAVLGKDNNKPTALMLLTSYSLACLYLVIPVDALSIGVEKIIYRARFDVLDADYIKVIDFSVNTPSAYSIWCHYILVDYRRQKINFPHKFIFTIFGQYRRYTKWDKETLYFFSICEKWLTHT